MSGEREKPLFAEERKLAIVEQVSRQRSVTVGELCARYDVSPATIRNDLRELEQAGHLQRTHGGAIPRTRTGIETTLNSRVVQEAGAKKRIAALAVNLVEDGDTVILDVGTTTYQFACLLIQQRDVQIVTNDLKIGLLSDEFPAAKIYCLGGRIRSGYHCTVGSVTVNELQNLSVDKAFLGTNGFDVVFGATTPDPGQAEVKRAMVASAAKRFLLCDHTKLGRRSFSRFAKVDQIHVLVTDRIEDRDQNILEKSGVEVRT